MKIVGYHLLSWALFAVAGIIGLTTFYLIFMATMISSHDAKTGHRYDGLGRPYVTESLGTHGMEPSTETTIFDTLASIILIGTTMSAFTAGKHFQGKPKQS